ncbi:MAG: crossover junction endodeoxyribonuclease RuvC [Actinomycetota bacterium]
MFVLGIDPGLSRLGYACVERVPRQRGGRTARAAAVGVIRTSADAPIPDRLAAIQAEVRSLIAEHRPAVVAIERVFFQVNASTAIGVAQSSGVTMAEAVSAGATVVEYTPNQVKEAVAGWGSAGKEQMQEMVRMLLGLETTPRPADAADAAAVALCHLAHAPTVARAAAASGRRR